MREFRTLAPFFRDNWWRYALGLLWLILVDSLQLFIPGLLGRFTDALARGELDRLAIARYALLVVAISCGVGLFRFLWRLYINGTTRYLEFWLRKKYFRHLLGLNTTFFDRRRTGDLMAYATNDVEAVRRAMGIGLVMLTDSLYVTSAAIFLMATSLSSRLTLLAILPLPLIAIVIALFGRSVHARFLKVQEAFASLTGKVQENIAGIRVVQSFSRENQEILRFTEINRENLRQNMRLVQVSELMYPLASFFTGLSFLIVLGYGGGMVIKGSLSLGDFIAFNAFLGMLSWPMLALGWVLNLFQRGAASMARLNDVLAEPVEGAGLREGKKDVLPALPQLEVVNLTFAYPGSRAAVLRGINLNLPPGGTLGLVGRTGSGKTTLAQLLLRLYEPPQRSVYVNGKPLEELDPGLWRASVGYVPQDGFLFSATIAENIDFYGGHPREKILEAARLAGLSPDLAFFTDGLDTVVGERGLTLSGGQKQRVTLARALVKEPALLILDDCLSAVDRRTEKEILANLARYRQGRSTMIISHRLAAIKDADHVLVLEKGRVVEEGSHPQLLARRGLYYRIYRRQALEAILAGEGGEELEE